MLRADCSLFAQYLLTLRAYYQSIPSIFIYNFSFQYTRWGAIFPEVCVPVLMLRTDCSLFALRYAHSSRLLPLPSRPSEHQFEELHTSFVESVEVGYLEAVAVHVEE